MADELREARRLLAAAADLDAAGRFQDACEQYAAARELLDRRPRSPDGDATRAMCLLRLAAATCAASPQADVRSMVAEALLAAKSGGCLLEAARWLSVLGARLGRVGRPGQAAGCLDTAEEIFHAADDQSGRQGLAWVALTRGQLALIEGDAEAAHGHATLAGAIFAQAASSGGAQAAAGLLIQAEEHLEREGRSLDDLEALGER